MTKNHKKGLISEKDISTVLQRYSATTILALLQEVAQIQDAKIDWNELVKKSTTGITNAREYQMLWRHLAYRDALLENLDQAAQPLEDDSDLEYELEVFPAVSTEASTEAAACVKVLIASGLPSDSSQPNGSTVEAPLTINIPNSQSTGAPSEISRGTNIMVPVSVQKQSFPEGVDANGSTVGNLPPRRKRKAWSEKEDEELIAAVQKCGEGNWASILKGEFKMDRTASQLSQRWAIIRKRKGILNTSGSAQLSEVQLATRRAMSIALDMPMTKDNSKATSSLVSTNTNQAPSISSHLTSSEVPPVIPQDSTPMASQRAAVTPGSSMKSRVISKKPSQNPTLSADALVKAAAVAAGARIATPSDAASLIKAAHAKNAVHIIPPSPGPHPNVHYIRTGLAAPPVPTYSSAPPIAMRPGGSQPVQVHGIKPGASKVQTDASSSARELNPSSEPNAPKVQAASMVSTPKVQVEDADAKTSILSNATKDPIQEDKASLTGDQMAIPNSGKKGGDGRVAGTDKLDTINSESINEKGLHTYGQSVKKEKWELQNGSCERAGIMGNVSAASEMGEEVIDVTGLD